MNISVIVPYHKNAYGLVYTLTMLQNQTLAPSRIVLIDTSKDKSGLSLAKIYCYNRIPIIVETAQCSIYEAWNKGIDLSPDSHCLFLNDDLVFPINMVELFSQSIQEDSLALVPLTPSRASTTNYIPKPFTYKSEGVKHMKTEWMPGFCFMLTKKCIQKVGLFNEQYKIWFGDTDYENRIKKYGEEQKIKYPIALLYGLYVHHFGGRSYHYKDEKTLSQIDTDRTYYISQYGKPLW